MKIIIVGCGKLGSALALELYKKGHTISVIDQNKEAFYRLGVDFNGNLVVGNAFDKNTLLNAEIEYADALVAATANDEINALTAKIAKDVYYVKHVVARLYNPRKAKIFESLGIKVISTTGFGVGRAIELLSFSMFDSLSLMGSDASTEIIRILATPSVEGMLVSEINCEEFKVIDIVRGNTSFIPKDDTEVQTGDILYFVIKTSEKRKLKILLGI